MTVDQERVDWMACFASLIEADQQFEPRAQELYDQRFESPADFVVAASKLADELMGDDDRIGHVALLLRVAQIETLLLLGDIEWAQRVAKYVSGLDSDVDAGDPLYVRLYVAHLRIQLAIKEYKIINGIIRTYVRAYPIRLPRDSAFYIMATSTPASEVMEFLKLTSARQVALLGSPARGYRNPRREARAAEPAVEVHRPG